MLFWFAVALGADTSPCALLHEQVIETHASGHYLEALGLSEREYTCWNQAEGPEAELTLLAHANLSALLFEVGERERALELMLDYVALAAVKASPRILMGGYDHLGSIYGALDQLADSRVMYERALEIHDGAGFDDDPDLMSVLYNLAVLDLAMQRPERAVESLLYIVEMWKENAEDFESIDMVEHYRMIASGYASTGDIALALSYADLAIADALRLYGAEHPLYAEALLELSSVLLEIGDADAAVRLATEALDVFGTRLPKNHEIQADTRLHLAVALRRVDRDDEACALYAEALEIYVALSLPHSIAITLGDLGSCNLDLGEFDVAQAYLEQAESTLIETGGEFDPWLPFIYDLLAEVALHRGQPEEAVILSARAVAVGEEVGGPFDPGRLSNEHGLALSLFRAGRDDEALEWATSALMHATQYAELMQSVASDRQRLMVIRHMLWALDAYVVLEADPAAAYRAVRSYKGLVTRAMRSQRLTLMDSSDPSVRAQLDELVDLREELANAILAQRDVGREDLEELDRKKERLEQILANVGGLHPAPPSRAASRRSATRCRGARSWWTTSVTPSGPAPEKRLRPRPMRPLS